MPVLESGTEYEEDGVHDDSLSYASSIDSGFDTEGDGVVSHGGRNVHVAETLGDFLESITRYRTAILWKLVPLSVPVNAPIFTTTRVLDKTNDVFDSKLSIDVINDTNAFRALVNEHLSSTVGSGIFLWIKFVRTKWGLFVTVASLDDNKLFMTKYPPFIDTIIFKVDMKVNNNNDVTMKVQR